MQNLVLKFFRSIRLKMGSTKNLPNIEERKLRAPDYGSRRRRQRELMSTELDRESMIISAGYTPTSHGS